VNGGLLTFHQPPHSVRVLKIVDAQIPASRPEAAANHPSEGKAGDAIRFSAENKGGDPVLAYRWDFGDGVTLEVNHAYTVPGEYDVHLTATSLNGLSAEDHFQVRISGHIPTRFDPPSIQRYQPAN
jgi:alpha-galactosidase